MSRFRIHWSTIGQRITVMWIAGGLLLFGFIVFVLGIINQHCTCGSLPNLGDTVNDIIGDFYANISVDCVSVAFAIFVIDGLNQRRAQQELKDQLIREMGSKDNGVALRAVVELRARDWLFDGSLRKANLSGANLEGADLHQADLQEAILKKANLRTTKLTEINLKGADLQEVDLTDANLHKAQLQYAVLNGSNLTNARIDYANLQDATFLVKHFHIDAPHRSFNVLFDGLGRGELSDFATLVTAASLNHTILPSGQMYDGCLNLPYDLSEISFISLFNKDQYLEINYYGISKQDYLTGQEWANSNLPIVRNIAGLDPETGRPLEHNSNSEQQKASVRKEYHAFSLASHGNRRRRR